MTSPDMEVTITIRVRCYDAMRHVDTHVNLDVSPEDKFSGNMSPSEWYGMALALAALGEKVARIGNGMDPAGRLNNDNEDRQHSTTNTDA